MFVKDGHARGAIAQAANLVRTMAPGHPGQADLQLLARGTGSNQARNFNRTVSSLGLALHVGLMYVMVTSTHGTVQHPVIPVNDLAEEILEHYPERLFAGLSVATAQGAFRRFWRKYRHINGSHPVHSQHGGRLGNCIPCSMHADEGTGLRKSAVMQCSWGPLITSSRSSWDRYFFWSCMLHEQYRSFHAGFEAGNMVLDSLMEHFVAQTTTAFTDGILS